MSSILAEKHDEIVQLKSEIVLLQNNLDSSEEQLKKRLSSMKNRIEQEERTKTSDNIKAFETKIEGLTKTKYDSKLRIKRLESDYKDLQTEFQSYRSEKTFQEEQRDLYVHQIEEKLSVLQKTHLDMKQ